VELPVDGNIRKQGEGCDQSDDEDNLSALVVEFLEEGLLVVGCTIPGNEGNADPVPDGWLAVHFYPPPHGV
jgi:hypothetical protein